MKQRIYSEFQIILVLFLISIITCGCAAKVLYQNVNSIKDVKQKYAILTKWYYDSIYSPLYEMNLNYKYLTPKAKQLLEKKINPLADKFKKDLIELGLILEKLNDTDEVSISTQTKLDQLEMIRKVLINYLIEIQKAKDGEK